MKNRLRICILVPAMLLGIALAAHAAPQLSGYSVETSAALYYSDTGWGGWGVPADKIVLGGGFQLTGSPASASAPGTPNSVWPHCTYDGDDYGWNVRDYHDSKGSPNSHVYAIGADMLPGYEVIVSPLLDVGPDEWAGLSAPAGKIVLSGGFQANGAVKVCAPALPNSAYPHKTYGADEYGWVVQSADATQIRVYMVCAEAPAGYEIITSANLYFSDSGWGGWSVPAGKVILGGGFESVSPVKACAPGLPDTAYPHYTYGPDEYGWVLQSHGGGLTKAYAICASAPGGPTLPVQQWLSAANDLVTVVNDGPDAETVLWVSADRDGNASLSLDTEWLPADDSGALVLWRIVDSDATVCGSGDFAVKPAVVTLASSAGVQLFAQSGVDQNGNAVLDDDEVNFQITLNILGVDIRINGLDSGITFVRNTPVTISLDIIPGSAAGLSAEFWLLAHDTQRDMWYIYKDAKWKKWNNNSVSWRSRLSELSLEVSLTTPLKPGPHVFFFGYDLTRNGVMDQEILLRDQVDVTVTKK